MLKDIIHTKLKIIYTALLFSENESKVFEVTNFNAHINYCNNHLLTLKFSYPGF